MILLPLYHIENTKKKNEQKLVLKINSGNVLLSQGLCPSTISAEKLNFRVRYGYGWVLFAIITRNLISKYRRLFMLLISIWAFLGFLVLRKLHCDCKAVLKDFFPLSGFWWSPRPISIGQLHALLHFHSQPIYQIFSLGSYWINSMGNLVLK